MLDDRFEDRLQESARDYNLPPETPREEMWTAIQARRTEKTEEAEGAEASNVIPLRPLAPFGVRRFRLPRPFRLLRPLSGIAAILALGFGLGRLSERGDKPSPSHSAVAVESLPRASGVAYQVVTTEHLSQSEAFLTLFRASVPRGGSEQLASSTARQLLATNRLLLDSPAASDARTRLLLQDLELVLAEIAQLSPRPRSRDLDLIKEGLQQGGVLSRLRTAVPSGASITQGAL
jgi:hypothetical protein